jgi:hypothetical protein
MNAMVVDFETNVTNYWTTEAASRGLFGIAFSKRRFIVLLPPSQEAMLSEMRTGRRVKAQLGETPAGRQWRVIFDDGSENPFCIHSNNGFMPLPVEGGSECWEGWTAEVWTQNGECTAVSLVLPARIEVYRGNLPVSF